MRFHLTTKLAKKLGVAELVVPASASAVLTTWYANLFRVDRLQYILYTNATTLFSIIVYGRGITTGQHLADALDIALREYLQLNGLYSSYSRATGHCSAAPEFCKTENRSVLGSMNDMVNICQYLTDDDPGYLLAMTQLCNRTSFKFIGRRHPADAFCEAITRGLTDAVDG